MAAAAGALFEAGARASPGEPDRRPPAEGCRSCRRARLPDVGRRGAAAADLRPSRAALERGDQLLHPDGLRHVVVHPGRRAQLPVPLHRVGRHGDDPGAALARPAPVELARGLEAVELRHLDVHEDHVVGLPRHGVDGFEAVPRHVGAVAHLPEDPQCHLLVHDVVLRQEDAEGVAAGHVRVELSPRRAALPHVHGPLGQDRGQRVEELGRLDGLVEVRGEALLLGPRLAPAERGEEDEGQLRPRRMPTDGPRQRHAVHLRHVHVEDADVEALVGPDPPERLAGRAGGADRHPPSVEMRGEDAAVRRVVVDHEDALAAEGRLDAAQVAAG